MLRMQEELQFAGEENTNESNSEACSEFSKHESVRKWALHEEVSESFGVKVSPNRFFSPEEPGAKQIMELITKRIQVIGKQVNSGKGMQGVHPTASTWPIEDFNDEKFRFRREI
ncbi:hypothetical protein JTB14_028419 [Gonioctena quinquepunctata]|nr:hypothetical protein JTB14_028419 [Gonioctena quinquepunctata]